MTNSIESHTWQRIRKTVAGKRSISEGFLPAFAATLLPETSAIPPPTYLLWYGLPGTFNYCKTCLKLADRLLSR
ncbi:hypothetical protein BJY01DRAFT_203100 [Aspergillus pseudoustus]|uniref:Uncharacterized protein n=1 Tax=Aspergillus pseudoustus TaxID=1810923 RepID=A0ABR4KZC5_9EURO